MDHKKAFTYTSDRHKLFFVLIFAHQQDITLYKCTIDHLSCVYNIPSTLYLSYKSSFSNTWYLNGYKAPTASTIEPAINAVDSSCFVLILLQQQKENYYLLDYECMCSTTKHMIERIITEPVVFGIIL